VLEEASKFHETADHNTLYTASVYVYLLAATPQPCCCRNTSRRIFCPFFRAGQKKKESNGRLLQFDSYMSKSRQGRRLTLFSLSLAAGYAGWISAFHCA